MKVQIRTASRLHFGLLAYGPEAGRQFGGLGVMVTEPGVELTARASECLTARGVLAGRAREFATHCFERLAAHGVVGKAALEVHRAPPQHAGLGVGTQLGLAVARAISLLAGHAETDAGVLACLSGRGLRSAVGAYGFTQGGLIVEGGKPDGERLAPLIARVALPEQWRFVLLVPRSGDGLHGSAEQEAMERLGAIPQETTASLCRLVLLELLPAAVEGDFGAFGESVYQIKHRVGECFARCQGGPYATRGLAETVAMLRRNGVCGVGQSSWGPTLFAVAEDPEHAEHICNSLQGHGAEEAGEVVVARVRNEGAKVELTNAE